MKKYTLRTIWHVILASTFMLLTVIGCSSANLTQRAHPSNTASPVALNQDKRLIREKQASQAAQQTVSPTATVTLSDTIISAPEPPILKLEQPAERIFLATADTTNSLVAPKLAAQGYAYLRQSSDKHVVRSGETLSQIALAYGVSLEELIAVNGIDRASYVVSGTWLYIPGRTGQLPTATPVSASNRIHVLRSGETLSDVSLLYDVSIRDLMVLNNIARANFVISGARLQIPSNVPAAATNVQPTTVPPTAAPTIAPTVATTNVPVPTATPLAPQSADTVLAEPIVLNDADANLYVIVQGNLARWNVETQTLEPIVLSNNTVGAQIVDFRISDDEDTILIERVYDSAEPKRYDLALFNQTTKRLNVIKNNTQQVTDLALTADGQWATYIQPDIVNLSQVIVVNTDIPRVKRIIAECHSAETPDGYRPCGGLFDSTDNSSVLFTDSQGVWRVGFDGDSAELLIAYSDHNVAQQLQPIAWSPSQRYLSLWGYFTEGAARFIFDSETNRLEKIPYTDAFVVIPSVSWLPNDNLFIVEPSDPFNDRKPTLTLMSINPDSGSAFMLTEEGRVAITTVDDYAPDPDVVPNFRAFAPDVIITEDAPFVLLSADAREQGLFIINFRSFQVRQVSLWPPLPKNYFATNTYWTPAQNALIALYDNGIGNTLTYYLTNQNDAIVRLPFTDMQNCCYAWGLDQ